LLRRPPIGPPACLTSCIRAPHPRRRRRHPCRRKPQGISRLPTGAHRGSRPAVSAS
jgi:hypothetical protein